MKKFIILLTMLIITLNMSAKSSSAAGNSQKKNNKNAAKADSRDGLSFETAVKVNTVEEEYKYLSTKYPGSRVLGQALVYDDNGTPYDILTVQMPDGKTVKYYFDVTEVFKAYEKMFGL
ncbi:hypothetical protein [Sebaldella sp. S0638]|uniref:hypothetical protein n=1 Tax=Sebaldella sp. S0638 TaxID=2957809 RepID=UPI00209F882C|nr:hypothetical protein [Sebaldella sp. S0638]MCP1225133.1 hypothetical protein [Sebaldella sp. S0638]